MSAERIHSPLWSRAAEADPVLEAFWRTRAGKCPPAGLLRLRVHGDGTGYRAAPERAVAGIRSLCADPARGRMGQARAPGGLGAAAGYFAASQQASCLNQHLRALSPPQRITLPSPRSLA